MSDLALKLQDDGSFDIDLTADGLDFSTEKGLETAVILSVFLDRRAETDDIIPDGSNNRRGSWQDDFQTPAGFQPGSRLWLLSREKTLPSVLSNVKHYLEECLQWFLDQKIADDVSVATKWAAPGFLLFTVTIEGAPAGRYQRTFQHQLAEVA